MPGWGWGLGGKKGPDSPGLSSTKSLVKFAHILSYRQWKASDKFQASKGRNVDRPSLVFWKTGLDHLKNRWGRWAGTCRRGWQLRFKWISPVRHNFGLYVEMQWGEISTRVGEKTKDSHLRKDEKSRPPKEMFQKQIQQLLTTECLWKVRERRCQGGCPGLSLSIWWVGQLPPRVCLPLSRAAGHGFC